MWCLREFTSIESAILPHTSSASAYTLQMEDKSATDHMQNCCCLPICPMTLKGKSKRSPCRTKMNFKISPHTQLQMCAMKSQINNRSQKLHLKPTPGVGGRMRGGEEGEELQDKKCICNINCIKTVPTLWGAPTAQQWEKMPASGTPPSINWRGIKLVLSQIKGLPQRSTA